MSERFCGNCGQPLSKCTCHSAPAPTPKNGQNAGTFERNRKIIPDCVAPNEGEIPIKQYEIAAMRNRILGIPYSKAIGRLQVTNKRVIFRAPGRCVVGNTCLQYEFAINELAGLESKKEYVFASWSFFTSCFLLIVSIAISAGLIFSAYGSSSSKLLTFLLGMVFGAVGILGNFFIGKNYSKLRLFLMGIAAGGMGGAAFILYKGFWYWVMLIPTLPVVAYSLYMLLVCSILPNLVLKFKTKTATSAIDIRRRKRSLFCPPDEEYTGYNEVIASSSATQCVVEINALINDIQKLGDRSIEKWTR